MPTACRYPQRNWAILDDRARPRDGRGRRRRSPTSRCRPLPGILTPAPPSRSGSSTATSWRSRSRCCRWPRSARSSAIAGSIWPGCCCSRWRRCSARWQHTLPLLTIARILQGFGAAGILSVNSALVRFTYPHSQLGRGIGVNALVVAISASGRPDHRLVHPCGRNLAVSVRHQRPARRRHAGAGLALPAAHPARGARLRLAERRP